MPPEQRLEAPALKKAVAAVWGLVSARLGNGEEVRELDEFMRTLE